MKMILLLLLILMMLFSLGEGRRRMRRGSGGAMTGAVLGNGVVTLIKDIRQKPQQLTKGYKREVEKPEIEEYTFWYKFKQGLKNFQYLAIAVGILLLARGIYELYKIASLAYLRYRISQLPLEQQQQLVNEAMSLHGERKKSPKKDGISVNPPKTRDLRLKQDQRKKLKR